MNSSKEAETSSPSDPIEVVVYFNDNTGIMLSVQQGQEMRADKLFELVLKEIKVEGDMATLYRNSFSLWFVSDILELQLKPSHIPFKLVCFWEELLEKYTQCSEETKQRDEPMIVLQRNVYMSRQEEQQIEEEQVLRLLYEEARSRVLQGRYPVEVDVAEELAVLQTMIMQQRGEQFDVSPVFFLKHLKEMLPQKQCRRNWLWRKSQNPEHRLAALFRIKQQARTVKPTLPNLYSHYLKHCQKLPIYGSVFMQAQVESPCHSLDESVLLCISLHGIALLSAAEQTILASIPFDRMSWQYAESNRRIDSNTLPCLFVLFPHLDTGAEVSKLLQIFSKSAILADNLIDTLISLKKTHNVTVAPNDLDIYVNDKKVALAVFDENGRKLKSSIRTPKDNTSSHPLVS